MNHLVTHKEYYPRITREGDLIEDSLSFIDRQDRREKMYLNYGLIMFSMVICFLVYNIESRREYSLRIIKEQKEKVEPMLNVREFLGIGK